jgi:transcriptional regulator with XRE-family HTH domain
VAIDREEGLVGVELWAEVRRMKRVEGLSGREISRRTGLARDTVSRLLAASRPPAYSRALAGSVLDPFKAWICEQLEVDASTPSQRLRELAEEIGYAGGRTIFDDYVREVRPRFVVARTFQRTIYRPAELVQCDLWEPREQIPVGWDQTRRGWVVTSQSCWSRAFAGTLIFSKQAPDILAGLARNLQLLGVRAEKLVWDRESAIAGRGRPTEAFLSFCGQLEVGSLMLATRRRRDSWSASTTIWSRTSSRDGPSRTTWTSRISWTAGA